MIIPLDRQATQPIYLQIRDRLSHLIASGALKPDDRLPSVRELAKTIQVNKLTVIEAYSVLEADGLIHARQGSGYFVSHQLAPPKPPANPFALAQDVIIPTKRCGAFCKSYMTSLQAHHQPGVIDFSSGFPLPTNLEDLQRIARRAMNQVADSLFQYDSPQGQWLLRQQIAQLLVQRGLAVSAEEIIVTSGSMQGLSLAMRYYIQPGDWVIVESPTYHGSLAILENLGARVIGIPMTPAGLNLELLSQYLQSHRPKLIYTISTVHNPTGITTSHTHRQQLLALAQEYHCPVVEDNAYEGLNYEPVPAPIKALDQEDTVIYLSTFSKTLMPGLRVGYMVVTGKHLRPLIEQKLMDDLHTPTPSQAIVSEYLASGHYRRHLNSLRSNYLQNRNVMLHALEKFFPTEVCWTVPEGGLFLWLHLPDELSIQEMSRVALTRNVLIASGAAFFPGHQGYPSMRLSFLHTPEEIESGISVLGELCKRYLMAGKSKTA
jgi:DNA-binding transcriptional MocR family regulator